MADADVRDWTAADVPDQHGRTAVVTGGNAGIGLEAARVLAGRGATVVLACRDEGRMRDTVARLSTGGAAVTGVRLDLGSLASVRRAADELRDRYDRVDLLINNAGVMDIPYGTTEDGFERQLGVNHLGHFALTGLLLDRLTGTPGSRVVTVGSLNHVDGRIDFDDLAYAHGYRKNAAYARSKLANLLFTYELQHRLTDAGVPTVAVAAHPGFARTELFRNLPAPVRLGYRVALPMLAQTAAMGALPVLRAATDPAVRGGEYYGPSRRAETQGPPVRVESSERSYDRDAQRRLWRESERLTGVAYPG